jgi:hypothetical protein
MAVTFQAWFGQQIATSWYGASINATLAALWTDSFSASPGSSLGVGSIAGKAVGAIAGYAGMCELVMSLLMDPDGKDIE